MPSKWYNSISYTINGFSFKIEKAPAELKTILDPKDNLIDVDSRIEEINLPDDEKFLTKTEREIANKLSEYRAIPTKNVINESYFLYDKSNLIKKTYITSLNKQIVFYGSFSYFSGKTAVENLTLLSTNNFLKFLIEKKSLKANLKFQLKHINGSEVKTINKKCHHLSITKLVKRKKGFMSEPIETVIIRAQQNFDVVGGLNPIQIEIKDDTVINI